MKNIDSNDRKINIILSILDRYMTCLIEWNLYESRGARLMENVKTFSQFVIGFTLIITLLFKGGYELFQTWELIPQDSYASAFCRQHPGFFQKLGYHLLHIKTFSYIASALAISAGLDLGYMLFTDGPDEALQPLMLCISSAAFYTIANNPEGSWVVGIYVSCIFGLMFSIRKYKQWKKQGEM